MTDQTSDMLAEALAQAHNALHQGDVEACHEILHRALGTGEMSVDRPQLTGTAQWDFDERFRALCIETGAKAGYMLAAPDGRLLGGGDADVAALIGKGLGSNRAERRARARAGRPVTK